MGFSPVNTRCQSYLVPLDFILRAYTIAALQVKLSVDYTPLK